MLETTTTPQDVPLDTWIASFDGRVLEIFTPYQQGSMRFHARLLDSCRIDGSVLRLGFARRDQGFWPFTDAQRPAVEALVAAVEGARTA